MILEDKKLYRQLNASNFDLAIVDLIANECRFFFKICWKFWFQAKWALLWTVGPRQYLKDKFNLSSVILPFYQLANHSLALARALHLPVATYWSFAFGGGAVSLCPELAAYCLFWQGGLHQQLEPSLSGASTHVGWEQKIPLNIQKVILSPAWVSRSSPPVCPSRFCQ